MTMSTISPKPGIRGFISISYIILVTVNIRHTISLYNNGCLCRGILHCGEWLEAGIRNDLTLYFTLNFLVLLLKGIKTSVIACYLCQLRVYYTPSFKVPITYPSSPEHKINMYTMTLTFVGVSLQPVVIHRLLCAYPRHL